MDEVGELTRRASRTHNGFLDIQRAALEVVASHSPKDSFLLARALFRSQTYQARSLAVFILGQLAAGSRASLNFLRSQVSSDPDWRVQEILAKAFDRYCSELGYEKALPTIRDWLRDGMPTVRRAVTEGLRIWTGRPYFRDHPEVAVRMLSRLRDDPSEYVRRSVGNALRDISRKHKELIAAELASWDTSDRNILGTYKLASKFLKR